MQQQRPNNDRTTRSSSHGQDDRTTSPDHARPSAVHFRSRSCRSPDGSRVLLTRSHVGAKNETLSNLWIVEAMAAFAPSLPVTVIVVLVTGRIPHRIYLLPQQASTLSYVLEANGGEARAVTDFEDHRVLVLVSDGRMWRFHFARRIPQGPKRPKPSRKTEAARPMGN